MQGSSRRSPGLQVNSALHPSGVAKSSTSFSWGKGGNVTSAGWQVTLCDSMWHVSSRSGVATLRTGIHLLLTYLPSMSDYSRLGSGHPSSHPTLLGAFGASIVVPPDTKSWRRHWSPPLFKVKLRQCTQTTLRVQQYGSSSCAVQLIDAMRPSKHVCSPENWKQTIRHLLSRVESSLDIRSRRRTRCRPYSHN